LKRRSLDPTMLQQRQWPPTVVSGPEGILQHRASSEENKECLIGTKADSWRLSPKEREGSGCGFGFGCGGRRPIPVVGVEKRVIESRVGGRKILARWVFLAER
jgi:hypothetical protein